MREGEEDMRTWRRGYAGMYEYSVTGCGWKGADGVRIGECI
jgi:hypothetical protein